MYLTRPRSPTASISKNSRARFPVCQNSLERLSCVRSSGIARKGQTAQRRRGVLVAPRDISSRTLSASRRMRGCLSRSRARHHRNPHPNPLPSVTLTSPLPQQSERGTDLSGLGALLAVISLFREFSLLQFHVWRLARAARASSHSSPYAPQGRLSAGTPAPLFSAADSPDAEAPRRGECSRLRTRSPLVRSDGDIAGRTLSARTGGRTG